MVHSSQRSRPVPPQAPTRTRRRARRRGWAAKGVSTTLTPTLTLTLTQPPNPRALPLGVSTTRTWRRWRAPRGCVSCGSSPRCSAWLRCTRRCPFDRFEVRTTRGTRAARAGARPRREGETGERLYTVLCISARFLRAYTAGHGTTGGVCSRVCSSLSVSLTLSSARRAERNAKGHYERCPATQTHKSTTVSNRGVSHVPPVRSRPPAVRSIYLRQAAPPARATALRQRGSTLLEPPLPVARTRPPPGRATAASGRAAAAPAQTPSTSRAGRS